MPDRPTPRAKSRIHLDCSPVWQIERDRYGVMFSGPLEVGECLEVIAVPCGLCGGFGAVDEVSRRPVPCIACGKASEGLVLTVVDLVDQAEPGGQRGGLRVIDGSGK